MLEWTCWAEGPITVLYEYNILRQLKLVILHLPTFKFDFLKDTEYKMQHSPEQLSERNMSMLKTGQFRSEYIQ